MTPELTAFFELLRCGLWQRPADGSLLRAPIDWNKVIAMAHHQTVVGVVAEAVAALPSELQPSQEIMGRLHRDLSFNVRNHARLNEVLAEVYTILQREGINGVLLKGQGLVSNYPNPFMRQCGDIDIYIPKDCQSRLDSVVLQLTGATRFHQSEKHFSFEYEGVNIELHYETEHVYTPFNDKRLQNWIVQQLEHGDFRTMEVCGVKVLLPPVEYDAIYILLHLWDHFISTGIGLRHVSDWALYMHRFASQLDEEKLRQNLEAFGFAPVWNLFASLAVRCLNMSWTDFPHAQEVPLSYTNKLLNIILMEGNFGRRKPRPKGYIIGKVNMYWRVTKMISDIVPFYPREVILYYFFFLKLGVKHFFLDWRHMR